jgi:pantoate--beta-alanine ligase
VFGQKDFQQSVLIRRMTRDLSFDLAIVVAPVVREDDGLALSSRNVYLSEAEHAAALALSRALRAARQHYRSGERHAQTIASSARQVLAAEPGVRVQYLELVDAETLQAVEQADDSSVLAVAAFVGKTRLIDNVVLGAD